MPTKQRRARIEDPDSSDEDTFRGSDAENTPKAGPSKARRNKPSNGRARATADDSLEERVPLKDVHLNDDAAEMKRRRKSTKLLTTPVLEEVSTPKAKPVNAVENAPAVKVSLDVMNTNFEEWMKMATDNVCIISQCIYTARLNFSVRKSMWQTR